MNDVDRLAAQIGEPFGNLERVWHCCREQYDATSGRKEHERLLDDPTAVGAAEHVDLVKDDPLDLADHGGTLVKHDAQHLGRHHEAGCVLIDRHI